VGGDIGSVVRDFCGCVSCSSGLHNEKTMNGVENDTAAPEVIIFNLTPKLLILNSGSLIKKNLFFFFLMLPLDQIAIEPLNFKAIYKSVLDFQFNQFTLQFDSLTFNSIKITPEKIN
jgi:hypothetical protein